MFLLSQSTHRMVIRYDPDVGHLYLPNIRARIPNEAGAFTVATNSAGFRSDIEFVAERSSRPRILFFGDSFTAGDGCDNVDRFAEIVGHRYDAEIYNYAVSGTGTDQQLLIYEKYARGVPADLVVLCIYVENIERNKVAFRESIDRVSKRRILVPKPYFTLDKDALTLNHVPVPLERPFVEDVIPERFQSVSRADNPLQKLIYKPLSHLKNYFGFNAMSGAFKERLPWLMPSVLKASGFQPHKDYTDVNSDGWRLMEAILKRFLEAVAPTPVIIVPLPHYYFFHDGLDPVYQPLFERLSAPDRDVHVLNVTRALTHLSWADRKRITFKYDSHYSPFGHQQVARVLGDFILAKKMLHRSKVQSDGVGAIPVSEPPDEPLRAIASAPVDSPKINPAAARPAVVCNHAPVRSSTPEVFVLGISAFYHNSAAALIRDGEIVAAAEEERFSRVKSDRRFPAAAINYCLEEAGIHQNDLAAVVYYDNAALTFERLMHTIAAVGADGRDSWGRILPTWLRYKLHIPRFIRKQLAYDGLVLQDTHHRSHAASAFYPSAFDRAAIVTMDGVGEWATGSIGVGEGARIRLLKEMRFPHSLGLLYSAFAQFTGFKVNSGEYKMMGLAPYGEPRYVDLILDNICDLKEDGSVELNLDYFGFLSQPTMTNEKFESLFGGPARKPDAWLTARERDIARSIQVVAEEAMLRTARFAHKLTGERRLCLAGGVALNCVANGRLLREGPFEDIWIQPAAGDAGCALGAALDAYHTYFEKPRTLAPDGRSRQGGSLLGPSFTDSEIQAFLNTHNYPHQHLAPESRAHEVAAILAEGKVVGHFSDRLEFGPRSLGARAILGDARNEEMQQNLNLKIKYRESFRPFAPSVLAERVSEYFELDRESPYMLLVAPVRGDRCKPFHREGDDLTAIVRVPRSDLPAITHVDYSARVQTVTREDHPAYYELIKAFEAQTGCGVVVNTSFNVRGEPIVCTPADAYRCFMRTEMDYLVLGSYLLRKVDQAPWPEAKGHIEESDDHNARDSHDDRFIRAVESAFDTVFLPAVNGLPKESIKIGLAFQRLPTTWGDTLLTPSSAQAFTLSPDLDAANPDPERMAHAIVDSWQPGPATTAFQQVLAKLLTINFRFREAERPEFDEQVTHTMYVMY